MIDDINPAIQIYIVSHEMFETTLRSFVAADLSKVPNTGMLARCRMESLETLLRFKKLRWLSHMARMHMGDEQISKQLLFGNNCQIINVARVIMVPAGLTKAGRIVHMSSRG